MGLENGAFALLNNLKDILYGHVFIRLYRQIVGIPMDTNSAPLAVDLFMFCYE